MRCDVQIQFGLLLVLLYDLCSFYALEALVDK